MLRLTLAAGHYDRTEALRDGRVRAEGIDLTYIMLRVEEIFWRMAQHREFDASGFSSRLCRAPGRGAGDLVAIPVFPSRFFRQSCIFVHAGSNVRRPEELRGKRIGVPEYQMTAAVWARGMLADDYGVRAADVEWVQGGLEEPGRIPFEPAEPPGVTVGFAPADRSLAQMLESGRDRRAGHGQDAVDISTRRYCGATPFEQPFEVERDYFRRTGIFPIMHTLVVKKEILDANPWVAFTLFKAFSEAKDLAMADLTQTSALPLSLPFLVEHAYQTMDLMGEDFGPTGSRAIGTRSRRSCATCTSKD